MSSLNDCTVFPWQCRAHSNYGNIMYDRRVVRGNTYTQHIIPTVSMKHKVTMLKPCKVCLSFNHFVLKICIVIYFDRWLSQTLLRHTDNRRSGGELLLENEPGSSSDPRLPRPCRAESTLMSKQVRNFSGLDQNFYICGLFSLSWICQMCCWETKAGLTFIFRALSRRIEWCYRCYRYWVPDWCFLGQTCNTTLHTCQIWQRCRNPDRGGRGRWSKWDVWTHFLHLIAST